jgi:ubiquinone/menaquinone biosynthesis C-methylase UbiE
MHAVGLDRQETLFERCWWVYSIFREYLFTDHTQEIEAALGPLLSTSGRHHLLEVGCGPGFYSRRLAARFPALQITGVDLSEPLLTRAREQARRSRLHNCRFLRADALSLTDFPCQVDAVIASRLFLILANRTVALHTIFNALRPGGLCFIAEPQSQLRAMLPLRMMQMVAHASGDRSLLAETVPCNVLCGAQFESFLGSQPWHSVRLWKHKGYQCALCEKAA